MAAQSVEAVPTASYYLVSVALVPDIENYPVSCAVVHPVQRNGELDRPKIGRKVAAGFGDIFYYKLSQFLAQRLKFISIEHFYIVR